MLTQLLGKQEMGTADSLKVVLQNKYETEAQGTNRSQSAKKKRTPEEESSHEKRIKRIETQWNKMTVAEVRDCMKEE